MGVQIISLRAILVRPHHIHKQSHIEKEQAKHTPVYHPRDTEQLPPDFRLTHHLNTIEATAMVMIGLTKEAAITGKYHSHLKPALLSHRADTMSENTLGNVLVVTNPDNHIRPALHKT